MKRLFTLGLLSIVFCYQANAQLSKGQVTLGGGLGANTSKSTSEHNVFDDYEGKNTAFAIYPQLSIGVGDNWMIGLRPQFSSNKQINKENGITKAKYRSQNAEIGAFARKFFPLGERFGLFGQGNVEYGFNRNKNLMTGDKGESRYIDVYVNPGAYFKATKRFILETTVGYIGYSRSTNKPQTPNEAKQVSQGFGISLTNNIAIGFHVIL